MQSLEIFLITMQISRVIQLLCVISKNKLSRKELNRQIYGNVEIFDKPAFVR